MAIQENWDKEKQRRTSGLHALYDYVMGILWLGVGLFFLLNKTLGVEWMKSDPIIDNVFGVVGIAYGIFRFYRGYQRKKLTK